MKKVSRKANRETPSSPEKRGIKPKKKKVQKTSATARAAIKDLATEETKAREAEAAAKLAAAMRQRTIKEAKPKEQAINAPAAEPTVMSQMPADAKAVKKEPEKVRLKYDPANPTVRRALPHIFGFRWYAWAKAFFDSTNKMNLLCAANQISKSSTQIRKCIDWATNTKKWPTLWPNRRPRIFWYMYPSNPVLKVEFEKKWIEEFLPRDGFERDEHFGYTVERTKNEIKAVHFFSGVSVYFKTYAQGADNLQTATVDAVFTDEELPEEIYDEVKARLFATGGYFHMVFTATLNQDIWRRALEGTGDQEMFPAAFKLQVSMYDCLFYSDGTPSHWTKERIAELEKECKSDSEIKKRILGRFVSDHGRKYPTFDPTRHFTPVVKIPDNWEWYVAADVGSGGTDGHPAALVYMAVRPDRQFAYVAHGWRGDGQVTTAGDVLEKHIEIRPRSSFARQVYDWQAKDFKTIAGRIGQAVGGWEMANKGHSEGEATINTLFRHDMVKIFDTPELRKLGSELSSLMKKTLKSNAKDDFSDAFRYDCMAIPWDFTALSKDFKHEEIEEKAAALEEKPLTEEECVARQIQERRGETKVERGGWAEFEEDIEEWNEAYG